MSAVGTMAYFSLYSTARAETKTSVKAGTLAQLHSVDPVAVGLAKFGQPQAFCTRQVRRWLQQYNACTSPSTSTTGGNPRLAEMLQLAKWLQEHAPAADACAQSPCIVHGDFRLDNLVMGSGMEVKAVLDWELATLGNPWADLAYNCLV
jgi:acyl-CoA dehydrogenase